MQENGATWIVVDPRFTRSAALADIYCPIRSGTDIAFYGGMMNYILENDRMQKEYCLNYTNISYLIDPDFDFDPETGLFSGWNEEEGKYDNTSWHYQIDTTEEWDTSETGAYAWVEGAGVPNFTPPVKQVPKKDPTLQDPNCVYQIMKKHYSRYTLDTVSQICGMDKDVLEKVYDVFTATGDPAKSGTILYALGQTQHHYGTNNTRAMCLVQLLLGNAGLSGGGVNALRGEPNVQGATDMCMLPGDFPGYLKWPSVEESPSLRAWCESQTYGDGFYTNKPKFMVSALKEWFGENATVDNDYGYDWLPKIRNTGQYTAMGSFHRMTEGTMKGYFAWGMNPCHSLGNTKSVREAFCNLDWLVTPDWTPTETSLFWDAPDMKDKAKDIQTEVYFLPAALIYEKSGTILNSGRWMQWRYKAVDPWDQAKPDYEIVDLLWNKIVELYEKEGGANPEPILNTKWDYYIDGKVDPRAVAWAMNGYKTGTGDFSKGEAPELLSGFAALQADGSTSNCIWIYGGFYNNNDAPLDPAQQPVGSRSKEDPGELGLYSGWAWAWPANRRILYNRASADMNGKPWNEDRMLVKWNGSEWETNDVPDFGFNVKDADGNVVSWIEPNNKAFMMRWEQNACFVTYGLKDMPLPEHYEPMESPTTNALHSGHETSPCVQFVKGYEDVVKLGSKEDYPIVATTYSITEHWQTGAQTHSCPALNEVQPKQFCEISEELAQEKGINNGDKVRVWNNRGSVEMYALVTPRMTPLQVNGETVHEIGMIHHWGWANSWTQDDVTNDLTPNVGDPNSFIPEYKAFLVDIEKA